MKYDQLIDLVTKTFLLKVTGAVLALLASIVVARQLGAQDAGLYFLSLSFVNLLSIFARRGFDASVVRHIAIADYQGNAPASSYIIWYAFSRCAALSAAVGITLYISSPLISKQVYGYEGLDVFLQIASVSIVAFSLMHIAASVLRGKQKPVAAMTIATIIVPAFFLVFLPMLHQLAGGVSAPFSLLLGSTISFSLALLILYKSGSFISCHRINGSEMARKMSQGDSALWIISIVSRAGMMWLPVLVLGIVVDSSEVARFSAAVQVSSLLSFALVAVSTVLAPRFASLWEQGNFSAVRELAKTSSVVLALVTVPLMLAAVLAGDMIMSVYGSEFERAGVLLAILAVGNAVSSIAGPVGTLLVMGGMQLEARNSALMGFSLMCFALWLLLPEHHAFGAAVSVSIGIVTTNVLNIIHVWKRIGR